MRLTADGEVRTVSLVERDFDHDADALVSGDEHVIIFHRGEAFSFARSAAAFTSPAGGGGADGQLISPMPGRIVSVGAAPGEAVTQGQSIIILEAMKMEHGLVAPFDGTVIELNAKAGDQVSEGVVLARLGKAG